MKRIIHFRYVLMCLPFIVGVVMFSCGWINLFSSLLLFLGGYITIKNTFDYRRFKKNIKLNDKKDVTNIENINVNKKKYINPEKIISIKRSRGCKKIRKRIK